MTFQNNLGYWVAYIIYYICLKISNKFFTYNNNQVLIIWAKICYNVGYVAYFQFLNCN
ncbi:hypothetical protein RhiirB3_449419 [Rhizophagus irregularis]|nr:hypothetical protein RhiirB3_449419 [Rhizophagus irregularis]